MKRILALTLAAIMIFSMVACTKKNDDTIVDNTEGTTDIITPDNNDTQVSDGKTVGNVLLDSFKELVSNGTTSPEEIVTTLSANSIIPFGPVTAPVEEGFLQGFDNDITGFKSGAVFMPMIGSIPFVSYVFELEDAESANAFVQTLKDNANPRWNICVEAEETVCEAKDNLVFFCMANRSFEQENTDDDAIIEDDIIYDDELTDDEIVVDDTPAVDDTAAGVDEPVVKDEPIVEDVPIVEDEPVVEDEPADTTEKLTAAKTLAGIFHELAGANTYETPDMLLGDLNEQAALPMMTMVAPMVEGYLPGFDNDITGFKNCAALAPMIGSIPFITYVFELEQGADVDAFVQTLNDNANPRWNICVTADETVCETNGNYVFFCMSPLSFEE